MGLYLEEHHSIIIAALYMRLWLQQNAWQRGPS